MMDSYFLRFASRHPELCRFFVRHCDPHELRIYYIVFLSEQDRCVPEPKILEEHNLHPTGKNWRAEGVFTSERCEQDEWSYWLGRAESEGDGFVVDLGCSIQIRKIILRNAHRSFGR